MQLLKEFLKFVLSDLTAAQLTAATTKFFAGRSQKGEGIERDLKALLREIGIT